MGLQNAFGRYPKLRLISESAVLLQDPLSTAKLLYYNLNNEFDAYLDFYRDGA
jgi:hypothetical protein